MGPTGAIAAGGHDVVVIDYTPPALPELQDSLAFSNSAGLVSLAFDGLARCVACHISVLAESGAGSLSGSLSRGRRTGRGVVTLPPAPSDTQVLVVLVVALPMVGLEFLTTERLRESWQCSPNMWPMPRRPIPGR